LLPPSSYTGRLSLPLDQCGSRFFPPFGSNFLTRDARFLVRVACPTMGPNNASCSIASTDRAFCRSPFPVPLEADLNKKPRALSAARGLEIWEIFSFRRHRRVVLLCRAGILLSWFFCLRLCPPLNPEQVLSSRALDPSLTQTMRGSRRPERSPPF